MAEIHSYDMGDASLIPIVSGFYDAGMDGRLWPGVLRRLGDAVGARICAIASHDYQVDTGRLEHSVDIDTDSRSSYQEKYASHNIWLHQEERFRTPGDVWASQQIIPDSELVTSDFYRDWLAPQNLLHHLFGVLDREGAFVTYLVSGRSEDAGPFGESEIALLRDLLPTMQRGLRAGQAHRKSRSLQRVAMRALDMMPIGIVLLSRTGDVIAANLTARQIIDTGEVLSVAEGDLWVDWGWRKLRFRDLVARDEGNGGNDRAEEVPAFSVPRSPGQKPLSVVLLPLVEQGEPEADDEPAALVFVGDPDRPVEIDPARISQLYGLNRAEARVVALVARGYRLDQVAEALGVAYEVVRKHLKQVFGKTGTARQAELVQLLVTGPAGLRY